MLCATDQRVRVFRFRTGRLVCSIDESISVNEALQQQAQQHKQAGGDGSATEASHVQIDNLEFGRRAAIERDTARTGLLAMANALFDESALFILYPTILGIKVCLFLSVSHRLTLSSLSSPFLVFFSFFFFVRLSIWPRKSVFE